MAPPSIDEEQMSVSSGSDVSDVLNLKDDEGWEDVEPEVEQEKITSLLDRDIFPDVASMLSHCKEKYNFDFLKIRDDLALDFYGSVRLVNFIRREVKRGHLVSSNISLTDFEAEEFLKPVLEDDALLFNLDDLPELALEVKKPDLEYIGADGQSELLTRVSELEEELRKTQHQFSDYRSTVMQTLDERWTDTSMAADPILSNGGLKEEKRDDDSHYFSSYSYNGMSLEINPPNQPRFLTFLDIHETMLKDNVRTNAYRDFIYNNKHLFTGKIVLDVGCGTGILSLFCAKAGAAKVLAVDNSAIIDKARENVYNNGFLDKIICLRGKIEDVTLPVAKVDIIVSEWMGYCLLYEAMLDSVIWARDKYLKKDGLMVPSHMNMWIAPLSDPDYILEHFAFWRDIYGFDMMAMQAGIYDDSQILYMPANTLCAEPFPFLQLDLHATAVRDLVFKRRWQCTLNKDIDALDGFVIWFDAFFMPSRDDKVPKNSKAEDWAKQERRGIAFTTGPYGNETHWKQGVFFVDNAAEVLPYRKGQALAGDLEYSIPVENSRALDVKLSWNPILESKVKSQAWKMR